jgi:hypothetical protein
MSFLPPPVLQGEGWGGGCAEGARVARMAPTLTLPRSTGGGDDTDRRICRTPSDRVVLTRRVDIAYKFDALLRYAVKPAGASWPAATTAAAAAAAARTALEGVGELASQRWANQFLPAVGLLGCQNRDDACDLFRLEGLVGNGDITEAATPSPWGAYGRLRLSQ